MTRGPRPVHRQPRAPASRLPAGAAFPITTTRPAFSLPSNQPANSARGTAPMTAPAYEKITPPTQGTRVSVDANGRWQVPNDPVVTLIRGDGIGRDVGGVPGITTCAV